MKNKILILFIFVIILTNNCNSRNSQSGKLQGVWSLIDIDKNGKANELTNSFLNIYGIDTDDQEVIEMYDEIMEKMIEMFKSFNLKISFTDDGQYKTEIFGQRTVSSYKINKNTIIVEQNGITTESDFSIEGNKLFYAGFIWKKEE